MRIFHSAALAAALSICTATHADAGRGASTTEALVFVAPTEIPGPDGSNLSLCMLTETQSKLFINFWRSAEGYGLAENKCKTDSYFGMDAATLADAQAQGLIAASIPAEPKLTLSQMLNGMWGLGLLAGLLIFAGVGYLNKSRLKSARHAAMGGASPQALRVLDIMCHAAKADGAVDASEIAAIAQTAQQLTGEAFATEQVAQMIQLSEKDLSDGDFKALGKGLSEEGKRLALRGALMVVAADGAVAQSEQAFIGGLSRALGVDGTEVGRIFEQLVGTNSSASAAPA